MQPDNQIVPVLPTFLQEGEVANVEEVKGSGHINYAVAFLGTLAEETKWKMFYELPAPCSWRTRGVSGWWAGTGRVPSRATWLLLLCSSQRRQHGRPDAVIFITPPRCHPIHHPSIYRSLFFLTWYSWLPTCRCSLLSNNILMFKLSFQIFFLTFSQFRKLNILFSTFPLGW